MSKEPRLCGKSSQLPPTPPSPLLMFLLLRQSLCHQRRLPWLRPGHRRVFFELYTNVALCITAMQVRFVEEGARVVCLSRSSCDETFSLISSVKDVPPVDDVALWVAADIASEDDCAKVKIHLFAKPLFSHA